jgi:ketosteroid isomerase-like protein
MQRGEMSPIEVVQSYFDAMKAGAAEVETLVALFADDAVYIEPFGGEPRTHSGRAAIEATLRAGMASPPPNMTLEVDRIDVDGDTVTSAWTCMSPAFPQPMRGVDVCTVHEGRIRRLEVRMAK